MAIAKIVKEIADARKVWGAKCDGGRCDAALREARSNKKALRELSDAVLVFLYWMDNTIGPDKTIPRELSEKLGKASNLLDMANDKVRHFSLGKSITAEKKKRDAMALYQRGKQ